MKKDNLTNWVKLSEKLETKSRIPYFKQGEIWWTHLGQNIGTESNGVGTYYLRPIIILTRFNNHSLIGVPLTTSAKRNTYRISIGKILAKDASVNISQLRYLDSKRLFKKICVLETNLFEDIRRKASEINFR